MWKSIRGYEGYYEVNDSGEVRSLDRIIQKRHKDGTINYATLKGRVMKQSVSCGYRVVNLRRDHTANVVCVHRLVAEAFLPNPNRYPTVNHKDGNKQNNAVENLEWASYSDNNIHALKHHLRNPRGNKILQFSLDGICIAEYPSTCEAARVTGLSREAISQCLNHYSSTSNGYIWVKQSESQTTIPQGSTREDELPVEAQEPPETAEDIVCSVSNGG